MGKLIKNTQAMTNLKKMSKKIQQEWKVDKREVDKREQ